MYPTAASKHHRGLVSLQAMLILGVRRAWRRMHPAANWGQQYGEDVGPKITALVMAAQIATTRQSDEYMAEVLNELAFGPPTTAGVLVPDALAGWAGDGRPVSSLLEGAVVHAGQSLNRQRSDAVEAGTRFAQITAPSPQKALDDAEAWLEMVTQTIIADTARAAESAAMVQRPWVDGYVRMLQPPSCSRCAVLAGKFYLYNEGFERHPRCDCIHIPAQEEGKRFGDMTTNPNRYFDSLPTAAQLDEQYPDLTVKMRQEAGLYSQEDIFTTKGAQAIRDGADISQVVNARRGMEKAQLFGHDVLITKAGTTRAGVFGHQERMRGAATRGSLEELVMRNTRNGPELRRVRRERTQRARLMPESIYEIAKDREDAIRLLKLYGFIF